MPCKIKVKVLAGRNLPVMDRASETTDAFVEIKFGGVTHKTDVCRKSLNPHWNSMEWYRFEVDEAELQDEPLQLRLMDHDTYSANDAIGKVVISLAPLLAREANNTKGNTGPHPGAVMSGWIPVFDTMHGIRGELHVVIKVELFSDFNKYKTSSCGVQFFHCPMIPPSYRATAIHGFVEELVVNDDPEYQWIDKIRTPRASNEARQVAFIKLSNQVQRLVGLKAAELGANAVIGYQQDFDLEGEAGVVARAIGTAVSITALPMPSQPLNVPPCSQQQLKKYLDILAIDDESTTDLNQYFQSHHDELKRLVHILHSKTSYLDDSENNEEQEEKNINLTRQSSIKSYTGSQSIYQDDRLSQQSLRHIAEDQTDLNKLLNKDDEDTDSSGPLRKIKNMKTSIFGKRFTSFRSRKSEKGDDQVSIKSNSSDTSKLSFADIKNEFKKIKRFKKPKIRKQFEQVGGGDMASILARSIIHTSLACIAETQDSEQSPSSTLRRTSESEPTLNKSDEDKPNEEINMEATINKEEMTKPPELLYSSMKNICNSDNIENQDVHRKISESCPSSPVVTRNDYLLKLPGEDGYFKSHSSALSGESSEMYSSSEDDEESSDLKTDTDVETTSSVVKTVLSQEGDPSLVSRKDQKLHVIYAPVTPIASTATINPSVKVSHPSFKTSDSSSIVCEDTIKNRDAEEASFDPLPTTSKLIAKKSNSFRFKINNPFSHKKIDKSLSAPSSPVEKRSLLYRSSSCIKRQISKISNSNMMKSISHYSLRSKKKQIESQTVSLTSSSSDVPSKAPSKETVLGSPFLSYTDLLSLDKDLTEMSVVKSDVDFGHSKVSMYIGSEPVSRCSISGPSSPNNGADDLHIHDQKSQKREKCHLKAAGLLHTAMETILIDKVQSLMIPTSPGTEDSKEKQFFDDINEKLEKVEEDRNKYTEINKSQKINNPEIKPTGLIHTAMQTMLIDKVQALLPSSTDYTSNDKETLSEINVNKTNYNISKTDGDIVEKTSYDILIDEKANEFTNTKDKREKTIEYAVHSSKNKPRNENPGSLINMAIETMLVDTVQSLLPTSPTEVSLDKKSVDKNSETSLSITSETVKLSPSPISPLDSEQSVSIKPAMPTIHVDEVKNVILPLQELEIDKPKELIKEHDKLVDVTQEGNSSEDSPLKKSDTQEDIDDKSKKLVRQNSVHSDESVKVSKENNLNATDPNLTMPSYVKKQKTPVLQHFHPIRSGAPKLETIPSLPESVSTDHCASLDIEGVECETNSASVCDMHAECDVDRSERDRDKTDPGSPKHARHESFSGKELSQNAANVQNSSLNATSTPMGIHRRSSDSDLSITPKGNSLNASGNAGSGGGAILRPSMNSNNLDMLEYPFLTMTEYPPGFIVHLGGTVMARSVKLVDGGCAGGAERAAWWAELRTELRAHARALRCSAVLAYREAQAICEDVCVLSASGTAAVINLDCDFNADLDGPGVGVETEMRSCGAAHVPYSPGAERAPCAHCRRARVPSVLLATCAKPCRLTAYPKAVPITAVAARVRRAPPNSEPGARDISDQLPFLEYELHKLLIAKLRMQGANALFSLETQIAIGERCVMALASGTAFRLHALPPPAPPALKSGHGERDARELQRLLLDCFGANRAHNGYDLGMPDFVGNGILQEVDTEEGPALDLCGDKDACVLELDEAEDVETAKMLCTRHMHIEVLSSQHKALQGVPPHAFAQVWRGRMALGGASGAWRGAERQVAKALDVVSYKLRALRPCAMAPPRLQLDLPEDEIQLLISGVAIRLQDSKADTNGNEKPVGDSGEELFTLDEEQNDKEQQPEENKTVIPVPQVPSTVSLTSLSHISGVRTERRVCALRLLFVRETTAVRELGGLSGFLHTFTCEALAIVRAYTAALGGNALTSFYITQLMLQDNAHKNQGQCLLSIGGDVVHVSY